MLTSRHRSDRGSYSAISGCEGNVVSQVTNQGVAEYLDEIADLLLAHSASVFRIRAYRRAADTVRGLTVPLGLVLARQGVEGLRALPGIGVSIAHTVVQLLRRGLSPREDEKGLRKLHAKHMTAGANAIRSRQGRRTGSAADIEHSCSCWQIEKVDRSLPSPCPEVRM